MTFKLRIKYLGKEYIEQSDLSFQALIGLRALLAEVGPSPHGERKRTVVQGNFLHLSRVLTAAFSEGSGQKEGQEDLTFFLLDCKGCFLHCENITSDVASVLVF